MKQSLVSYDDFAALGVSFTPQYIRKLVRKGVFPLPVNAGRRKLKLQWVKGDVLAWVKAKRHDSM